MSNDVVVSKIELLEEQIENLERSGYFTEKEMDRLTAPKYVELESLRMHLSNTSSLAFLSAEHLTMAVKGLAQLGVNISDLNKKHIDNIKVNNPIILTQNTTQK